MVVLEKHDHIFSDSYICTNGYLSNNWKHGFQKIKGYLRPY